MPPEGVRVRTVTSVAAAGSRGRRVVGEGGESLHRRCPAATTARNPTRQQHLWATWWAAGRLVAFCSSLRWAMPVPGKACSGPESRKWILRGAALGSASSGRAAF